MSTSVDTPDSSSVEKQVALIDQVCEQLRRGGDGDSRLLCRFAREFLAKVPRQLLAQRTVPDLAALTRGAFEFLKTAQDGRASVEVVDPAEEGWEAPATVIRAEVGDRPFIVDTIREYLSAQSLPIQHYVYPVIGVKRDDRGRIVDITAGDEGSPRAIVHCEVPVLRDPGRREEIRSELERRLGDVVAATDDFQAMLTAVDDTARRVAGYRHATPTRAAELAEIEEFLRWLTQDNFVFLGYRAYEIVDEAGAEVFRVQPGTGLGILRDEATSTWAAGVPLAEVSEELRRRAFEGPVLITTKTNAEATVHRRARMDYVGIKRLSADGKVVGEDRFLGLFTSKAYAEHADAIPILRRKLDSILVSSGAMPGSHDYKEIITIFNSMPKEDLFQASIDELEQEVQTVLNLLFSDEVQVSLRHDPLGRGVSVMVILPRGRFSGDVRHRIQDLVATRFKGSILNYHLAMSAGDQARLHFYVSSPPEVAREIEPDEIAVQVRQIIRSWDDRLHDELVAHFGDAEASRLAAMYGPALLDEYRAATLPEIAVQDVVEFERMRREKRRAAITLREPRGRGRADVFRGVTVLKLYLVEERLILSDFLPILHSAGLRVIEVSPFAISGDELPEMMIYAFALQGPDGQPVPQERTELVAEAVLAVRNGVTQNDPFNALVVEAGLRWREVDVIRLYANYAFQAGLVPTRFSPARALARHPELARIIFEYFRARFDPDGLVDRGEPAIEQGLSALRAAITSALEGVTNLSDDRAIRRIVTLIDATMRTNYFRHGGAELPLDSDEAPYLSIKIRSADVEELRRSRLLFEVYVFSAQMEGIHLRGAPVSRGGIRWSDRPDDFRTEVLGLVQTQIVKNAVIVPGGSKGGFVTKRQFDDREAMMAEVAAQYRTFIRGLLDLTDNRSGDEVIPPPRVVRYDGDDPYLVVAADKGTAHLSDVANEVAAEYDFWLGDAFASGGSHGYDHKKEGITAKGAWECVKRHFREMGKDIQKEPFSVAGIGDMSGDVFGNGMLLSRQIRLIAAFDHRHVFIDPDPDPAISYIERERLFGLGRSSWADYDRAKLSDGAMIVPRTSKAVELTPEARGVLGIDQSIHALDGEALVRAVLCAPVELFWNGGIGTYVRSSAETNADVGDAANDPVRIEAAQLRCAVIGEGGNLGLTQRARVEYALRGGRINTDALDNSGGVDMSDHEVNLKILLAPLLASGEVPFEARNALLQEMTPDVTRLVLKNNREQSLAVSLDEARSREAIAEFAALISAFERDQLLERVSEGIPSSDELRERADDRKGMTRPTLCVLLAYAKLHAHAQLLASAFLDDPATETCLGRYFPDRAREVAGMESLRRHSLRREIVSTQLVNELVDLMGAAFLHRVARDLGRPIDAVVAAWYVASGISGAGEIRADLERLEGDYPAETIYRWLFGLARVLERTTRWTLANVEPNVPVGDVIEDLKSGLERLRGDFARIVSGSDRILFEQRLAELRQLGVDGPLAQRLITLRFLPELLDILRVAREAGSDPILTGETYYLVGDRLGVSWIQQNLRLAASEEIWEKRLVQSLDSDLQRAHRTIARRLLDSRDEEVPILSGLEAYLSSRPRETELLQELVSELSAAEVPPLAGCAVAVRALVELAER